jgi:hypothetical protein
MAKDYEGSYVGGYTMIKQGVSVSCYASFVSGSRLQVHSTVLI